MADYIGGVDFWDGTGPSALPPNDVARAFRDADDFALLGRGLELWSRLTGDDHGRGQNHPRSGAGGGRDGPGRVGKGGRRGGYENGRRRRVVHVESATTGKFFKVTCTTTGLAFWSSINRLDDPAARTTQLNLSGKILFRSTRIVPSNPWVDPIRNKA